MKKILLSIMTAFITLSTVLLPASSFAVGFNDQRASNIGVQGANVGGQGNEGFIGFVESAVNWILGFLAFIAIIIFIWGGFLMLSAAGDEGKYKKGFTILKQAAIGLILIGTSALIVNLIFSFVTTNTTTTGMIETISTLA